MAGNRGRTTLRCRKKAAHSMTEYDRLPEHLREWVARAALPWRAGSVVRSYRRALARTGDPDLALEQLDRIQESLIAKDARKVWGPEHPAARSTSL